MGCDIHVYIEQLEAAPSRGAEAELATPAKAELATPAKAELAPPAKVELDGTKAGWQAVPGPLDRDRGFTFRDYSFFECLAGVRPERGNIRPLCRRGWPRDLSRPARLALFDEGLHSRCWCTLDTLRGALCGEPLTLEAATPRRKSLLAFNEALGAEGEPAPPYATLKDLVHSGTFAQVEEECERLRQLQETNGRPVRLLFAFDS